MRAPGGWPVSDDSAIEWTDATWNPVTGCTKLSAGCDHCYAERFAERFRGVPGHPYEQGFDLRIHDDRFFKPLTWRRPRKIFVNSMSDLFHAGISENVLNIIYGVRQAVDRISPIPGSIGNSDIQSCFEPIL